MILVDRSGLWGFSTLPPQHTLLNRAKMANLLLFCFIAKGVSKQGDFEGFKVNVTVSWQGWLFAEKEFTRGYKKGWGL